MPSSYVEIESLNLLVEAMQNNGSVRLFFKVLGKNNNDKQQIYLATDMAKIGFLPTGVTEAARSRSTKKNPKGTAIFRSSLPLSWLNNDGCRHPAPSTKLIYYPQYPEVRVSGFLENCELAPNELLSIKSRGQEPGRVLFLGVTGDGCVLAHVVSPNSAVSREISNTNYPTTHGVLKEILFDGAGNSRQLLLHELARIHRMGWINPVKLTHGGMVPYDKRNAIGYTLEAHLGILPNGDALPDFHGWEVKGSTIKALGQKMSVKISIMTGSPTGGLIREIGWRDFVMRYGYRNDDKPPGRIDFNGVHTYGVRQAKTGLLLDIEGYENGEITDETGGIVIKDIDGQNLLKWHFSKFIDHWKTKHSNVVFVPGVAHGINPRKFRFDRYVKLGIGTDFFRVLDAIKSGSVVYDSGLWVNPEGDSPKQRGKERHQIRVTPSQISSLYRKVEDVDVLA
jgi:hypothetical protein